MKFTQIENDPNPKLIRTPDEECLATWWHQATPGTTYWRCLVPARHLPGQTVPLQPSSLQEQDGKPFLPEQRGTSIWQFLGDGYRTRLALGMRELYGTRTLMEVDDNYLRVAPYMRGRFESPWKETIAEAGNGYSHERHRQVAPQMDGIICSTEYLADIYSDFNEHVWVCPNSVDPDDWQFDRAEPDGIFRIVYYGSPSHMKDTPLLTKALKWAVKQPGVEVWTVGFKNHAWSFPHQQVPWNPVLEEARKELFRFDLGLAPLMGNPWSRGKSDVKLLEYSMAGVLPLFSRETPFEPWFDYFPDLALEADDWLPAIRWAIANQDDVKARAQDCKEFVMEHRSIQANIHKWHEVLNA